MLHDQLRRHMAEPFGQRDLFVSTGAEHFQELQNIVAGVLDIVAEVPAHYPNVAGAEVVGRCLRSGIEYCHPSLAAQIVQIVLPLVGVGMPVQLSHPLGSTVTSAAAMVLEIVKLVLSAI